jgi:FkbH-like protein
VRCVLLSNVNVESIARRIARHEVHVAQGYGAWTQELANPASGTWVFRPSCVLLVVDGGELLRGHEELGQMLAEIDGQLTWIEQAAQRSPEIKVFVSTIDVPPRSLRPLKHGYLERRIEQHWHSRICQLAESRRNVYAFDLKSIVEQTGRAQFYSNKRWYLGGLRFSIAGEKLIAKELERILDAQALTRKKCLLLDLDNTLWGGVIGEEGLEGIELSDTGAGARYKDFQRRLRDLAGMGVILGVVSKNNEADVEEVFEKHEHMVLRKQDFAARRINWSPKAQSIAELAQDLDIGIDSMVFVDDNPVEREAIRAALPEVTVPEFPADTSELCTFAEQLYAELFFVLESTQEDRKRTESYLANARRAAERNSTTSPEEFFSGLRTKISLHRAGEDDIARAAQLTQKTNQFNLTTRRYTEQEVRALARAPCAAVYVASVADKYGDNGKVFVAIVRRLSADTAELETFLMSCRVMGRFIEDQILDEIVRQLRADGVSRLRVQFIPTRKNAPARAFVERLRGGRVISGNAAGAQTWEFDISRDSLVTRPAYAELLTQEARGVEVIT